MINFQPILLICSLLMLGLSGLKGQYNDAEYKHYGIREGLVDNNVTSILQDNQGYIWAATEHGLSRFNGRNFDNFHTQHPKLPIPGEKIKKLIKLSGDNIAILSRDGAQIVNTVTFKYHNLIIEDSTNFKNYLNYTFDIAELPTGYLLATATGYYLFDRQFRLTWRLDYFNHTNYKDKIVRYAKSIHPIDNKNFLIYALENDLVKFDPTLKISKNINRSDRKYGLLKQPAGPDKSYWLFKHQITRDKLLLYPSFLTDSIYVFNLKNNSYVKSKIPPFVTGIGYSSGFYRMDDSTFVISCGFKSKGYYIFYLDKRTDRVTFKKEMINHPAYINCFFKDREGRIWIGCKNGLYKQNLYTKVIKVRPYNVSYPDTLINQVSSSLTFKDKIYTGLDNKKSSLLIFDRNTFKLEDNIAFFGGRNDFTQVSSIVHYKNDTLWIGTFKALLWFDTRSKKVGKVNPPIPDETLLILLKDDSQDCIWAAAYMTGALFSYDLKSRRWRIFNEKHLPKPPFHKIKNLVKDYSGNLWLSGHGLARLDNTLEKFDRFYENYGGVRNYDDNILDIRADDRGGLWLFTPDNDLLEYNIPLDRFNYYSLREGMITNSIHTIGPVLDNKWWFATERYLAYIDIIHKRITKLSTADGLPEEFITESIIFSDDKGKFIYWFQDKSIYYLNIDDLSGQDYFQGFNIDEMIINQSKILPAGIIKEDLHWSENNFQINFGVLDYEEANNYTFEYKVNDQSWTKLADRTSLYLSNLKPGFYVISFKATNKFGKTYLNKTSFCILAPFYARTWFVVGISIFALTFIAYFFIREINKLKIKSGLEKELAASRMQTLHAQMNPHFVFNSLNSINEMVIHSKNDDASFYLSKFSRMLRLTLQHTTEPFIPLREMIDYLILYVEMEHVRNPGFTCTIDVNKEVDTSEVILPPMLLQPFLENSIWHGPGPERQIITIKIDIYSKIDEVICVILDDGIGITKSKEWRTNNGNHKSLGMENVHKRIEILNNMYNFQCRITINDRMEDLEFPGRGTVVRIFLPQNFEFT